jgi:photosystem II stability/assembly factor-like uncharacterized protein
MMLTQSRVRAALLLVLVASAATAAETKPKAAASPAPAAIDAAWLQGLEWRNIGPFRGGRVTAVTGVPRQPLVYYFGGTGGGIWKTTDAGINWRPVSDGQLGTGSVGAVAVAASDPNVVYAGMGEACIRGNVSHGDGVYRSSDAGKTWTHVGLADSRQIGRIRVHPANPDLVYVAALGHTFGPSKERGVFRSRDGGATWQNVLFVDDKTGAVDLAMDAVNPRVMYASFWQAVRTPWSLESGGPGGSLWKTEDGGDHWSKLTGNGLPSKGVWGRIGVAVSPARPERVWALIEAEDGGVYRSEDGGRNWRKMNDERRLRQRAWYYTHIFADPANAESVYVLNTGFYRSLDGGRTFSPIRVPHGDNHDLWIAPEDPQRMIESNDGGANVSFDGGGSWSSVDNQPTAQFYHVITDQRFPYYVYGAQQDNSTVGIASRTSEGGIDRTHWYDVGGCESGYIAPRPDDPLIVYAGCYGGQLTRYDHRTGQTRDVNVYPDNPMGHGAEGMKYRFQWTFPIVISPHDPHTLYAGANVLFKSTNEGQAWTAISPDLTRNDPKTLASSGGPITKDNTSVEYYGTIFAFAESPKEKGLLWTGSDDGLVQVSRNGGQNWTNVTPKALPEWTMVSQVEPSPHDAGTMFLAVNRYKLDDYRPYAYVTTDYGQTWRSIAGNLPAGSFVRAVRQDPVRKDLLFAGTETGVYVSFDGGGAWQPLQMALPGQSRDPKTGELRTAGRLPVVPVTDLVVKGDDLVVSTQGRSFWILDDIGPLRQLAAAVTAKDMHLFTPSRAVRFQGPGGFGGGGGAANIGRNPPNGAVIYYYLKAEPKENEEVKLEFLDASGAVVRTISNKDKEEEAGPPGDGEGGGPPPAPRLPVKAGLNRFPWNMRLADATRFKGLILWAGRLQGPTVVPGRYQVRLTALGKSETFPLEIVADPRLGTTQADYQKQYDLLLKIRDKLTQTHDSIARLREARDQVKAVAERSKGAGEPGKAIADGADAFAKKVTAIEEELYQTKNQSNQDPLNYPIRLNNKLAALAGVVAGAEAAPTDQAYAVYEDLTRRIDAEMGKLKQALGPDLEAFNRLVREKDVPAVLLKDKPAR